MSSPTDDISNEINRKACDELAKALEVDLFHGKDPQEYAEEQKKRTSKYRLQKITLKMLGWQCDEWGTNFSKRNAGGIIVDSIFMPTDLGGSLAMESIESILKNITHNINDLKLWKI
jgi:hypothetical protein